ncbi:CocE/NonD family hydrolase [Mycolicibacterium aichiense]|uniref:X-Pro dipeptidyl-peptidase n=2 Tax=Mycolicibacterium TaxID=1866885 RepID=A0AAD1MBH6_9MYCO|nr:CocE/NonD family hydrolase [Mycolicibacterium aichiense]MCV7018639.1 CocE/NonD family hydrolase [Mycolicibacterium aichiense]BBX07398.1 X-Pro dipeptidyl-peptidase [Mycolicibacterium aichiense]STZ81213.1 putative hydrolase, CocE/NonD family [Mycolicibacterium aichiense]
MTTTSVSGIEPGQRTLNGPQTTGRDYRNLSTPDHHITTDINIAVPMRDGVTLLADVHRPDADGRFPALIAASPYPRQIQDLGAPAGFIEAGATDFWVPRGYTHVIANLRGTGGSGGTFGFFDAQERRDLYDLVEWVAAQPWCDGNVGMIGISYFAMTQLEAAVERPPHLKAIFPVAVTADLYEAAMHHGMFSASFVTPFLSMLGLTAARSDTFWRSRPLGAARWALNTPRLHHKFATMNGEAAVTMMRGLLKLPHDPHPWDELWLDAAVKHPTRDAWWDERNLLPLLEKVDIPAYLGCDWQNVPLHLPSTFTSYAGLTNSPCVRVGMLGEYGLTWPWESLHIEALAWYDHWLKGRDTGILDGPPVRYVLPGTDGWRTAESWPPACTFRELALRADGTLDDDEASPGARDFMALGSGLGRAKPSSIDPPSMLTWTSQPLVAAIDVVGDIELRLIAAATAADTAWIVTLSDVSPDGTAEPVTAGWLRAGLREVDEAASRPGAPVLPCRHPQAIPIGDDVEYRIPLVPNARRFGAGHCIQITITSDDQDPDTPAIMNFRHAGVGTSSVNTVRSSSRLVLPVLA